MAASPAAAAGASARPTPKTGVWGHFEVVPVWPVMPARFLFSLLASMRILVVAYFWRLVTFRVFRQYYPQNPLTLGASLEPASIPLDQFHLGVDHDLRMLEDTQEQFARLPGEWGLGDLAYQHAERYLTGRTRPGPNQHNLPVWTEVDDFMKEFIAFYRGRVENIIHRIKNHMWCQTAFRGSFEMLTSLNNIAVLGTALEIRLDFEIDDKISLSVLGRGLTHFTPK